MGRPIVDPSGSLGEDVDAVPAQHVFPHLQRRFCVSVIAGAGLGCAAQKAAPPPASPAPAWPVTHQAAEPEASRATPSASSEVLPLGATPTAEPPPSETPEARLAFWKSLYQSPRHHPAVLDQAPRLSRLAPGAYACRVSREYRLRDCRVEQREGRTFLEVSEGNLFGMRGVLWDEGPTIRFEGWLSEEQPFGCTSCQDRCYAYPGSCACDPLPAEAIRECVQQPLRITFRPAGKGRYRGLLEYAVYYNEYIGQGSERHAQGYSAKPEQFEVLLVSGPPPATKQSPRD